MTKKELVRLFGPICLDYLFGGRTNFDIFLGDAFNYVKKVQLQKKRPDILTRDEFEYLLVYCLQENNYHVIYDYMKAQDSTNDDSEMTPGPYLKLLEEMEKLGLGKNILHWIDKQDAGKWGIEELRQFIITK